MPEHGAGAGSAEVGFASESIVNGTTESGMPEVVAVLSPRSLCSGTIISPYAILAAKQCVVIGGSLAKPSQLEVLVGNDVNGPAGVTARH